MQLMLRLYYPEDSDLIAIRTKSGRGFCQIIRDCLNACVSGIGFSIPVPQNIARYIRPLDGPMVIAVAFDENNDSHKPLIKCLNDFPAHNRNNIIKSMLRAHFDRFPLEIFLQEISSGTTPKRTPAGTSSRAQKNKPADKNGRTETAGKEENIADKQKNITPESATLNNASNMNSDDAPLTRTAFSEDSSDDIFDLLSQLVENN